MIRYFKNIVFKFHMLGIYLQQDILKRDIQKNNEYLFMTRYFKM